MLKRIICLLMALIMCTGLFSCQTTEPPEEESKEETDTPPEDPAEQAIWLYGSATEEKPRRQLSFDPNNGNSICYLPGYVPPPEQLLFSSFEHIVRVRYTGKTIYPESQTKRAEYKFEVIECLKGEKVGAEISLYSAKFPARSPVPNSFLDQSLMYFFEYSSYEFRYEKGKEYIVVFNETSTGYYAGFETYYFPLYLPPSAYCVNNKLVSGWEEYKTENAGDMTPDEFVSFLKRIIEKYDQSDSDSSEDTSDSPSDNADSTSGG